MTLHSSATSNLFPPSKLEVARAVQNTDYIPILLRPSVEEETNTSTWISQLPFPVQIWTSLDIVLATQILKRSAVGRKTVFVIPPSSERYRLSILNRICGMLFFIPFARFLFVLGTGEHLPLEQYPAAKCLVMIVNETTLSYALEDDTRCLLQDLASANDRWGALKHKRFVVGDRYRDDVRGFNFGATIYTHAITLHKALTHLNVTIVSHTVVENDTDREAVVMDLAKRKMDIFGLPWSVSEYRGYWIDASAFIDNSYIKFYSRRGTARLASLHLHASVTGVFAAVLICAVLVLCAYSLSGGLLGRPTSASDAALFLYAMSLGRGSDSPASSQHSVARILFGFWLSGMFFFSALIQSDLTSETSVPSFSRGVETVHQLEQLADMKRILPCVEPNLLVYKLLLSSRSGLLGKLGKLLEGCGSDCTGNSVDLNCSAKGHRGTHVYMSMVADYFLSTPGLKIRTGLVPGKDHLGSIPSAFFVSRSFPYGTHFRKLVMAMLESGLSEAPLKSRVLTRVDPDITVPKVQFWSYIVLYVGGCGTAFLVALLENASNTFRC